MRPELERYAFVLLRRPPDAPELSEEEGNRLQEGHLAHLQALRNRGLLAASGPFRDQADESWRGLCLLRTTPEAAVALFDDDPLVLHGRLAAEGLTWLVRKGDIACR